MKQVARIDYLDLQIYDEQKSSMSIPLKDEDGISYNSTLLLSDVLAKELFDMLGMPYTSSTWGNQTLYQSDTKEVFISSKFYQKSMQFKGLFFLDSGAVEKVKEIINFLKERKIKFLVSRIDISFIVQDLKMYQTLDKCDYKQLSQYTLKKKKEIVYYKIYNSRFNLVVYGKSAQIKKEKGKDYLKKFLTFYELSSLPDDLLNFELRVLGTDSCGKITEQIINDFDTSKIKLLVLAATDKRIKLTKGLKILLNKLSI